ncbi:MAG: hypothetical protein NTZ29_15810 [Verrucomicrobia bacterium]|nr:hypothetical protein [Verrucomicrobiota bacterium]
MTDPTNDIDALLHYLAVYPPCGFTEQHPPSRWMPMPQPFLTEEGETIQRLRAELAAAHARIAELQSLLDGVLA